MRVWRLLAVGLLSVSLAGPVRPAFAQAPTDDNAPETDASASPDKPARKPAPRASAPTKPAASKAAAPAPATTASGKPMVTSQDVRPPASMMVDCAAAPKEAVTKLPDELARWATIYCTKLGHIFNADDRHFGAFPDNGLRASFSAGDMVTKDGVAKGEPGNEAYFTTVTYRQLSATERNALVAADPSVQRIYEGKALWQLDLTAVGGKTLSFLVIEPTAELFWVFPLGTKGIDRPAFYVTSLDALNKAR